MNSAEKEYWGDVETMMEYLRSVRRPGEEPDGYDDRDSFEYAVMEMETLGEAGETALAELMKMKALAEKRSVAATPKVAVA